MIERENEFDCLECGRHIIRFAAPEGQPKLCAMCTMMPGWFRNPDLRELLDPAFDENLIPEHER